ncbi:MAG: glycosyltransferase, partial [Rubrobacteraceae bacterium]
MNFNEVILAANYAILGYFFALNGFYLLLYAISFVEVLDYTRREVFGGYSELFASNYAPPISVIVPAYNEEATIAASVRSFLSLRYPVFEVIVVNDGSKDRTVEILLEEFDLRE